MSAHFAAWLRENDAWIHDALQWPVVDSATGSRGCGVSEEVPPETVLLTVPRKLMWVHDRALAGLGPLVETDRELFEDNEQLAMATFLLQEAFSARGVSRLMSVDSEGQEEPEDVSDLLEEEISPWEPYLRMLPPMSHFSGLPFLWSEEELSLLGDKSWASACRFRLEELRGEFARVQALLEPWRDTIPRSGELHIRRLGRLANRWTWEAFSWAQCVYRTRCFLDGLSMGGLFALEGMDAHLGFAMVPFVDMLNHSATNENATVDWEGDELDEEEEGGTIDPEALMRGGWDASAWGHAGGGDAEGKAKSRTGRWDPARPWGIGVPPGTSAGVCHVVVGETPIRAGDEVCISYGSERAMFDLVETYGFFDRDADIDRETMLVPLPSSALCHDFPREDDMDGILWAIRDVGYTANNMSSLIEKQGAAGWLSLGMGDRTVPSFLESLRAVRVLCFSEGVGYGDDEAALVEFSRPEREVQALQFMRELIDQCLAELDVAPDVSGGDDVSPVRAIATEYRARRRRVLETHQQLEESLLSTVGHFGGCEPVPRDTFTPLKELSFANHDLLVSYLQVWARFAPGKE